MHNFNMHLGLGILVLFCICIEGVVCDYGSHPEGPTESEIENPLRRRCTYDRLCDNGAGYVCREGLCTCKWGRADPFDGWKCKVEVRLGDFCADLGSSKFNYKRDVVARRKCPYYAQCNEKKGICECRDDYFQRKGSTCIPKVLNTTKSCRDHLDCVISRGQQCNRGFCVECAIGRFKHYKSSTISGGNGGLASLPECVCPQQVKSKILSDSANSTENPSPFAPPPLSKGACILPSYYGSHCSTPSNCPSPQSTLLTCSPSERICECRKGTRSTFAPENAPQEPGQLEFCVSPVNAPCSEDAHCHPSKAYCEIRAAIPVCRCKNGFQNERGDCVSRFYLETCGQFLFEGSRLGDLLKEQKLSCIGGVYECELPRDMFWEGAKGRCVSLVGGRCALSNLQNPCAGNSRCWEYNNLKEHRCQCQHGWKPSQDRRYCVKIKNIFS